MFKDDGTWTDIPRCIEHEPGKEEQIPGLCPGITGYCSDGFLYQKCNFLCDTGKRIDSVCTQDGTWEPYPTCPGDLRDAHDGCNPCPGPAGGSRNRTLEGPHSRPKAAIDARVKAQQSALETRFAQINNSGRRQQRPTNVIDTGNRVVRPTFAGSLAFGSLSSSASNSQSNIPSRSNVQSFPSQSKRPQPPPARTSFIPQQTTRPQPPPARATPAPIQRRPVVSKPSPMSQPSFSSNSNAQVIEPKRTSPFLSVGPDGRLRSSSDPNLSGTRTSGPAPSSRTSGPAPSFNQQSSRRNQFQSSFSQQRNQNMFTQQSQGRRPQSSFTPAQKQIIQDALAKLPKNNRGGSNGFSQQSRPQQQKTPSLGQFKNFQKQQNSMSTMPPRRLNFNPLRDQSPRSQTSKPQSGPRFSSRPQPPTPPPRQSTQPQRRPAPTPTQANRLPAPKKKLSALEQILALQSNKGPTGAKNGGTPPPPTEKPKPRPVMLFQEDNANPRTVQGNQNSFGVFSTVDLSNPSTSVQGGPQLRAFPAIPNTARSSRSQSANNGFNDNSQFGVFETVQL